MVGTTFFDASYVIDGSTSRSGTPTKFNPSRIQPVAGKAINELPVVYLDLFKKFEVVINTKDYYKCDVVITCKPEIIYGSETTFNTHDIYVVVRFLCDMIAKSAYNLNFAQVIAYLKCYLNNISTLKNSDVSRQRILYSTMSSTSNAPAWFLNLREAIANITNCESSMPEVDYWIQREGKFIIRLLSLLIDNERKNIGRIVIEEDPYI